MLLRRERRKALPHITRWQVTELVTEPAGAAAAVRHRDDGGDIDIVALESAQDGVGAGAPTDDDDLRPGFAHGGFCSRS